MLYRYTAGFFFLFVLIAGVGCEKYRLNRDTTTSQDYSQGESIYGAAFQAISRAVRVDSLGLRKQGTTLNDSCASYVIDTLDRSSNWPRRVTINYGTSNCKGPQGYQRRGTVVMTYSGPYLQEKNHVRIQFNDFYVNDYQLEADSFMLTNQGQNAQNHFVFRQTVTGGEITSPDGEEIRWSAHRVREWVEGTSTPALTDDIFRVTGSIEGESHKGRSFEAEIRDSLLLQLDCPWVVEGVIQLYPEGLKDRVLDFGNGNCDNDATVQIEDRSYKIKLGQR